MAGLCAGKERASSGLRDRKADEIDVTRIDRQVAGIGGKENSNRQTHALSAADSKEHTLLQPLRHQPHRAKEFIDPDTYQATKSPDNLL